MVLTSRFHINEDFLTRNVLHWYHTALAGAAAHITVPSHASICLLRSTGEHVCWCPEGQRGVTMTLTEAMRRLHMLRHDRCP
jgi:hypothetical protein